MTVACLKMPFYTVSMKALTLFFISLFAYNSSFSAPIPNQGSDTLAPELGIHTSKFGFEILAQNTQWIKTRPPKKSRFIETVYRSPAIKNKSRGTLTVRVDRMQNDSGLQTYVKRWVKEYPKYGYNVLGSKPFQSKGKKGYIIDSSISRIERLFS